MVYSKKIEIRRTPTIDTQGTATIVWLSYSIKNQKLRLFTTLPFDFLRVSVCFLIVDEYPSKVVEIKEKDMEC